MPIHTRAKVEVEFPEVLIVNEPAKLSLHFSPNTEFAHLLFRFDPNRLWITGEGKLANPGECSFEFRFPNDGSGRDRQLDIGIKGKLEADSAEPIEVYLSSGRKQTPALLKAGSVELRTVPKQGIGAAWRRISDSADAAKKNTVAFAKGMVALIIALSAILGIIPALVERSLIAVGFMPAYFEGDSWEYSGTDLQGNWLDHGKWQTRDAGTPKLHKYITDVRGAEPGTIAPAALGNRILHDFTFETRIWDPLGAAWVIRSQSDLHEGYFFWIDNVPTTAIGSRSTAATPFFHGRVVFLSLWSRNLSSKDLVGSVPIDFSGCCGPNDALQIKAEVSDYSFKYWVRRINFVDTQFASVGGQFSKKPLATFRDPDHHFHSGGFGFEAHDVTKGMMFEGFRVEGKTSVSLANLAAKYALKFGIFGKDKSDPDEDGKPK